MAEQHTCPTCGQPLTHPLKAHCALCGITMPAGSEPGDLCTHCAIVRSLENERYRRP